MIQIKIPENQLKSIELSHWKWFEGNYEKNFFISNYGNKKIFSYKKYNNNLKKYETIKIHDEKITEFLSYIMEPKVLKPIVVGKLFKKGHGGNSIQEITKGILKKFPKLFSESINKSVNSFLELKRKELKVLQEDDIKKSSEIKDSIGGFFRDNKEILKFYINNLDEIPSKIDKIKLTKKCVKNFDKKKFVDFIYNEKGKFEEVEKILNIIFNYNSFINDGKEGSDEWGAYKLLDKLQITTCPYCNRNYIHTYIDDKGMSRADIDHFYPKSKYPFLAVSLYNFIPSCHTCNSSFKSSVDTFLLPHLYPYNEHFGEAVKFKIKVTDKYDPLKFIFGSNEDFKIFLEIKSSEIESNEIKNKIKNSTQTFKIEELYEFHKDYAQEIIKKAVIYSESQINEWINQYPQLFDNKIEVLRTIFSNYIIQDDLGKRPLAKLTKDICDEFNIQVD